MNTSPAGGLAGRRAAGAPGRPRAGRCAGRSSTTSRASPVSEVVTTIDARLPSRMGPGVDGPAGRLRPDGGLVRPPGRPRPIIPCSSPRRPAASSRRWARSRSSGRRPVDRVDGLGSIALTADKEPARQAHFRAPSGSRRPTDRSNGAVRRPGTGRAVVVKPVDGAGSVDTFDRPRPGPAWPPGILSHGRPGLDPAVPLGPASMSASYLVDRPVGRATLIAVGRQRIEVDAESRMHVSRRDRSPNAIDVPRGCRAGRGVGPWAPRVRRRRLPRSTLTGGPRSSRSTRGRRRRSSA